MNILNKLFLGLALITSNLLARVGGQETCSAPKASCQPVTIHYAGNEGGPFKENGGSCIGIRGDQMFGFTCPDWIMFDNDGKNAFELSLNDDFEFCDPNKHLNARAQYDNALEKIRSENKVSCAQKRM